jgi:hypothetical protein
MRSTTKKGFVILKRLAVVLLRMELFKNVGREELRAMLIVFSYRIPASAEKNSTRNTCHNAQPAASSSIRLDDPPKSLVRSNTTSVTFHHGHPSLISGATVNQYNTEISSSAVDAQPKPSAPPLAT